MHNSNFSLSLYYDTETEESTFNIHYLGDNQLRIKSKKFQNFLIYENGQFRAGKTLEGNDVLETVTIQGNIIALRVVNVEVDSGSGSGSGEMEESPSDCYLGFSDATSEPKCYESFEHPATKFYIH